MPLPIFFTILIIIFLFQGSILLQPPSVKGSVEICGDGVDNNSDGQIEEKCDKVGAHQKQSRLSESNSYIDFRDNQRRPNQVHENGPFREDLEASSFYENSGVNTDLYDAKNSTGPLGEILDSSNSTQQYQAYETSTVVLVCQICIDPNFNSMDVRSYTWNQVGGAYQVALSSYNTSKTSFLAPEINSPVDVLNFMLKVIDGRGVVYNEKIEILIRNTPGT